MVEKKRAGLFRTVSRLAGAIVILLGPVLMAVFPAPAGPQEKPAGEVPVINGRVGSCTADFLVTDTEKKPLYNAKIQILLKYGFAGTRQLELTIGTNGDGKARFEGLPPKVKKPCLFNVSHGGTNKSVEYDPKKKCEARYEVVLGAKE